jgi:hypothetical protein
MAGLEQRQEDSLRTAAIVQVEFSLELPFLSEAADIYWEIF